MTEKSILVVEDDESLLSLAKTIFDLVPYECIAVPTAEEALQLIKEKKFTIFVLDIYLGPGMHGVDLAVILRKKFPTSKIYAITGYLELFTDVDPIVAGFDKCFLKPDGISDLIKRIKLDLNN